MTPKNRRILLVSTNTVTNPYPVFPLGLAFLEAALKADGNEVRIHDQLIHDEDKLADALDWAGRIGLSMRNVDNVSSTRPVSFLRDYRQVIKRIRAQTNAPIIGGGSAFSIFPEAFMKALDLNFGIQGEAELSITRWMRALRGECSLKDVPGLLHRTSNGSICLNLPQAINAAEIPSPRPDPEWIRAYLSIGGMANAQTQRGCALKCTYCTYPWIEGRCYRHRNARDVVAEMQHLKESGAGYVFLTDSVFNTSREHVESVCHEMIASDLGLPWGCFARPASLAPELLDLMVLAGLQHIEFGSDSFCDTTLESYGKSFRFDEILEVSQMAAKRRVNVCHYIIFGGPGETEQTIRETVANSRHLPDSPIFAFSGMRIYPHTPLHGKTSCKMSAEELLEPAYYSPPDLEDRRRETLIRECTRDNPNWFLSDHADNTEALTSRLRRKGKQGPLWEYLAVSRRLRQELNTKSTDYDLQ